MTSEQKSLLIYGTQAVLSLLCAALTCSAWSRHHGRLLRDVHRGVLAGLECTAQSLALAVMASLLRLAASRCSCYDLSLPSLSRPSPSTAPTSLALANASAACSASPAFSAFSAPSPIWSTARTTVCVSACSEARMPSALVTTDATASRVFSASRRSRASLRARTCGGVRRRESGRRASAPAGFALAAAGCAVAAPQSPVRCLRVSPASYTPTTATHRLAKVGKLAPQPSQRGEHARHQCTASATGIWMRSSHTYMFVRRACELNAGRTTQARSSALERG